MTRMTETEARAIARAFIASVKNGPWTMKNVDAVMPRGWEFDAYVTDESMYPMTIASVAHVIRDSSTRIA